MEFVVTAANNATAEVAAASSYPDIRVFSGPIQNHDTLNTVNTFNHTHDNLLYTNLKWARVCPSPVLRTSQACVVR